MTHPEALVIKLRAAINAARREYAETDWRGRDDLVSDNDFIAGKVLDLFEVREEHVNPNQYLYGGLDVPQNGRRFVLTTAWEPTDA